MMTTQKETPMNFDELYDKLLEDEKRLHDAKRNDYTGSGDPLANYRAAAASVDIEVWKVLLSRMQEKMYRLKVLLGGTKQQVAESIADTCLDVSVIAKLVAVWYELEGKVQPETDGLSILDTHQTAPSEIVAASKVSICWSEPYHSWQVTDGKNNVYIPTTKKVSPCSLSPEEVDELIKIAKTKLSEI